MYVTGRGSARRPAAPVAGARVASTVRRPVRVVQRRRRSPPQRRSSRAPRAGGPPPARAPGTVVDVEVDAVDRSRRSVTRGGRAGRSAGSCRSPSSAARRRRRSGAGRLNAAIRARQWASIDVGVDRAARARHDEGDDCLQPVGVAGADDRRLEDVGMLDQHALDLGRRHPDPAGLDHVAVAPEERPVAVGRARVDVAGRAASSPWNAARRRRVAAPVPGGDRRARARAGSPACRASVTASPAVVEEARRRSPATGVPLVPGRSSPVRFDRKMCSASVVPMPSSTGWPKRSAKRRCRSAGSASPAVTVARTEANASDRARRRRAGAATKPGLAKNSVGCSAAHELGDVRRRRPDRGSRIAVAPTASGNVSELPSP